MGDAELYAIASGALEEITGVRAVALAAYVRRYTDPTPLAECLERVAGERGGRIDEGPRQPCAMFGGVNVYFDGVTVLADRINGETITTAGELHRLLDAMGVGRTALRADA